MKTKILIILFAALYLCTGCFLNTRENISKLEDKKFYFTEFEFILLGQDKETAYAFFKKFPVKKIMYLIAAEYNITIDISHYNDFINKKNLSMIKTDGTFRVAKNTWKKRNDETNRVVFIFEQDYMEPSRQKFSIALFNGKTTLKIVNAEISEIGSIITQLKSQLQSGKENLKVYEEKNYEKVSPIPFIIETNDESVVVEEPANLIKIKAMIDEYVNTLNKDEKNIFKHEIIDYIYQKCDGPK